MLPRRRIFRRHFGARRAVRRPLTWITSWQTNNSSGGIASGATFFHIQQFTPGTTAPFPSPFDEDTTIMAIKGNLTFSGLQLRVLVKLAWCIIDFESFTAPPMPLAPVGAALGYPRGDFFGVDSFSVGPVEIQSSAAGWSMDRMVDVRTKRKMRGGRDVLCLTQNIRNDSGAAVTVVTDLSFDILVASGARR